MLRSALVIASLTLVGCVEITADETQSTVAGSVSATMNSPIPDYQRDSHWYRDAAARVAEAEAGKSARNVVFFLGDGMGISTVTAARILAGQRQGKSGEENRLSFENFPVTGLVKTYNVDSQTADSAGTMSAIVTGVKTNIGVFGVNENVTRSDCASATGVELRSILEIAELAGMATGVISTARITHATPGATYAKAPDRDWEDDSEMPAEAIAAGCEDIASQLITLPTRLNAEFGDGASDGIEVTLGGGRRNFFSASDDSENEGRRGDNRNLIEEWSTLHPSGEYVTTAGQLNASNSAPLLGLFSPSHMPYASERAIDPDQPSLTDMSLKALELLKDSDDGYLLIIEAGRIDHAHHAGNAANALGDTIELSEAVAAVMDAVDTDDTLVMVTADHSHVFTMAGYPRRGNPILGKVVPAWSDEPLVDEDGKPYTTLGYMNGRGFRDYGDELNADKTYEEPPLAGRQDISDIDTTAPGYHQEALIPLGAETHGGEDVAVYAIGPGSKAASGVNEQNLLFHVMLSATDWEERASRRTSGQ